MLPELELSLGGITLLGASVAARATAFAVPELDVALDVGRLTPALAERSVVLLTHGHLDHLAGVLAYFNVRARLHPGEPTRVLGPPEVVGPLRQALAFMPGMESVRRRMQLDEVVQPACPEQRVPLAHGQAVPFELDHGVPGLGWRLFRPGAPRPLLVYGGDSATTVYERDPGLLDADIALVECTFVEPNRRVAARLSGHAHILDWLELAPRLSADYLVLAHLPALPWQELVGHTAPLAAAFPGRLVLWAESG